MKQEAFKKRSVRYLVIRFALYTSLILLLYFFAGLPLSYTVLFILFLIVKAIISPDKIEEVLRYLLPNFSRLGVKKRRVLIWICYMLILFGLKVLVIDFVFKDWWGMSPQEDFSSYLEERGVNQNNFLP